MKFNLLYLPNFQTMTKKHTVYTACYYDAFDTFESEMIGVSTTLDGIIDKCLDYMRNEFNYNDNIHEPPLDFIREIFKEKRREYGNNDNFLHRISISEYEIDCDN